MISMILFFFHWRHVQKHNTVPFHPVSINFLKKRVVVVADQK